MQQVQGRLLALLALCVLHYTSHGSRQKAATGATAHARMPHEVEYVLVSQPKFKAVVYFEIDSLTREVNGKARPLISTGLQEPFGIAIDQKRSRLFVADARSRSVVMYYVVQKEGGLGVDDDSYTVAEGVTPRWVAVDENTGSIFITDEQRDSVSEVTAEQIDKIEDQTAVVGRPKIIYAGDKVHADRPGGVAADGYHVFWANKARGKVRGTVIEGLEHDKPGNAEKLPGHVRVAAHNIDKAYGVCLARGGVYYTGESKRIYGARLAAHGSEAPTVITTLLHAPRGCAFDGDGSIYVADKSANELYSFPVGLHAGSHPLHRVARVNDPYGVAVFRPPPAEGGSLLDFVHRSGSTTAQHSSILVLALAILGQLFATSDRA